MSYHKVNVTGVVNINGTPHHLNVLIGDLANLSAGNKLLQLVLRNSSALIFVDEIKILLQLLGIDITCSIRYGDVHSNAADNLFFVAALLLLGNIAMKEECTSTENKYTKYDK